MEQLFEKHHVDIGGGFKIVSFDVVDRARVGLQKQRPYGDNLSCYTFSIIHKTSYQQKSNIYEVCR